MNEKDLGKALLDLDATTGTLAPDPRVLTARILERDRRRVRLLTGLSVGAWVLTAALVLLVLVQFGFLFPMHAKLQQEAKQPTGRVTPAQREQLQNDVDIAFRMGSVLIALSVGILSLAALSTVGLVRASRQATLRQVNVNLVEISEQLKQLRQTLAK